MVSKIKLLGLAAVAALLQAAAAHAAILDWSFTAADGTTGSGTFAADLQADNVTFLVTSATGTIGGEAVTLSTYDFVNNQAYATSPFVIDTLGIAFQTASGFWAIYEDEGLVGPNYFCGGLGQAYCIEGPNDINVGGANVQALRDLSITVRGAVPEPATWGLMLVGFGGLGAAMRQRRKLALAA